MPSPERRGGYGRREFLGLAGGAAVAWPVVTRGQQSTPVIGFLRSSSLAATPNLVAAFREGLKEVGFVEGQNVTVELGNDDRSLRLSSFDCGRELGTAGSASAPLPDSDLDRHLEYTR